MRSSSTGRDQLFVTATKVIAHAVSYIDTHIISVLADTLVLPRTDLKFSKLLFHLDVVQFLFALPDFLPFLSFPLIRPDLVSLLVLQSLLQLLFLF